VATAGQRVREARITTEELEQSLKNWTEREARDRLTSELGIDEKTERLASGLQQADHWLEVSESTVQLAQRALGLANLTSVPVETEPVDGLLEQLASLRAQLAEATELVERIREQTDEADQQRTLRERVDRVVHLTLRVIATLHSVDSRLQNFQDRVPKARANAQNLETKIRRSMQIAAISVTLLALWMAAGQISLCRYGWKRLQQLQLSQPPNGKESSPKSIGTGDG
jgi:hypothetical protein